MQTCRSRSRRPRPPSLSRTVKSETPLSPRPRDPMPSLATITRAWEALGEGRLRETFPHLACFSIGWGEPFCFRCGWLAPTKEAADCRQDWPASHAIDSAWQGAGGWLERCHLQDHSCGGSAGSLNLVPLCVLCHEEQPPCETRAAGIAFVNSTSPRSGIAPWMQMITDELGRDQATGTREGTTQDVASASGPCLGSTQDHRRTCRARGSTPADP
jgi:hypothetical protein